MRLGHGHEGAQLAHDLVAEVCCRRVLGHIEAEHADELAAGALADAAQLLELGELLGKGALVGDIDLADRRAQRRDGHARGLKAR